MSDPVNPTHYRQGEIEAIDAIESMLTDSPNDAYVDFCLASALQYIWRLGRKGDAIEQAKKAKWYIDRALDHIEVEAIDKAALTQALKDIYAPVANRPTNEDPVCHPGCARYEGHGEALCPQEAGAEAACGDREWQK